MFIKPLRYIRSLDRYGHTVQLNFNQQGETVNTIPGGFVSILMYIIIYGYFILKLQQMLNFDNPALA